jgi:hypothetical protein
MRILADKLTFSEGPELFVASPHGHAADLKHLKI